MKKRFVAAVFLMIIFLPAALGGLELTLGKRIDTKLTNDNEFAVDNSFSISTFMGGEFQKNFENNLRAKFLPRGIFVKTYNQILFTFFNSANNLVVGKDDCLFEEEYICEYLGLDGQFDYSSPENMQKMDEYLSKIGLVSKALEGRGKKLILCITPNKCDYMYEYIPSRYKKKKSVRGADYIRENAEAYGITLFDSNDYLKSSEYPVFYMSGIHWSVTAEQTVTAALAKEIGANAEVSKEVFESENEIWRECDLYKMLNIWQKPKEKFYAYKGIDSEKSDKQVIIQGGSFAEGIAKVLFENGVFSEVNDIFYGRHMNLRNADKTIKISNWKFDDDIYKEYFDAADVFVLEVNERNVVSYSSGFVDFLYEYLENR